MPLNELSKNSYLAQIMHRTVFLILQKMYKIKKNSKNIIFYSNPGLSQGSEFLSKIWLCHCSTLMVSNIHAKFQKNPQSIFEENYKGRMEGHTDIITWENTKDLVQ